ncbi:MAG TPA: hypothetical protein VJL60_06465, partial [Gammaproteobacteria bacterium]|nr:hypothetical protein [Gammaproteobacteria bacterium]
MFDKEEIHMFNNYLQSVIEKPRPIEAQPHVIRNGCIWCDDWKIIEILKYFINGPEMYAADPPPNRLKNNPLWSKEEIVQMATEIKQEHDLAELIIEHFKQ